MLMKFQDLEAGAPRRGRKTRPLSPRFGVEERRTWRRTTSLEQLGPTKIRRMLRLKNSGTLFWERATNDSRNSMRRRNIVFVLIFLLGVSYLFSCLKTLVTNCVVGCQEEASKMGITGITLRMLPT